MSINIVNLSALKEKDIIENGILYMTDYSKKAYSGGAKHFIVGTLSNKEVSLPFKVWDSSVVDFMDRANMIGTVVKINGEVTKYQNSLEIKVNTIEGNLGDGYSSTLFLKTADVDKIFGDFVAFVNSKLSEQGVKVLLGIFQAENLFPRFKEEFAGKLMHDALIGGLMSHTTKMLNIANTIVENEPRFKEIPHYTDLLYLGIVLHDIGKVHEMHFGVYQPTSFVTHRTLGTEMLLKYKEVISQVYDEKFFYQILSVINGHHGDFGEKPQTLLAYIVHLIDMLEAMTTGAFDKIERNDISNKAGNDTVYMNGSHLVI